MSWWCVLLSLRELSVEKQWNQQKFADKEKSYFGELLIRTRMKKSEFGLDLGERDIHPYTLHVFSFTIAVSA